MKGNKRDRGIKMNKLMCESCGKVLDEKDEYFVEQNSGDRTICTDCVWLPLDVLRRVYVSKNLRDARKIIREFDDDCENSFLENG